MPVVECQDGQAALDKSLGKGLESESLQGSQSMAHDHDRGGITRGRQIKLAGADFPAAIELAIASRCRRHFVLR